MVQQVVAEARKRGLTATIVTFSGHPLQVLRPDFHPLFLTLPDEKVDLLQQAGIDQVALLPFTPQLAQLTAQQFMHQVLQQQLQAQVLVVGYDNHFGHGASTFQDYVAIGQQLGIDVVACPAANDHEAASSTAIRQALLCGDIATANRHLGYPYFLQGQVVQGFHNGHRLGYPTANLQVGDHKLIPQNGVYLVRTNQGYGMLNIGLRPTLHNGPQRSIEVHIFDFHADLYGQSLRIELLHHLRHEQEFTSLDALHRQLQADEQACRQLLETVHF